MTTVLSVLNMVSRELTDESNRSWTLASLVSYYNSALAAMANYRPDLFAHTLVHTCVAGTRQTLPPGAGQLITVERNTGGGAIRFIEHAQLDEQDPEWVNGTGHQVVEAYCYDVANPGVFWLYPGVAEGVRVDVVLCVLPAAVTTMSLTAGAEVALDDAWLTPLMDWIVYRAYLRDSDDAANSARGQLHQQAFANYLGVSIETVHALAIARRRRVSLPGGQS